MNPIFVSEILREIWKAGVFNEIDVHFASFIARESNDLCDDLLVIAAFLSNAAENGNVGIDINEYAGKKILSELDEKVLFECSEYKQLQEILSKNSMVGRPGDYLPIILDPDGRLYLHRLHLYEEKLAEIILERTKGERIDDTYIARLKPALERYYPDKGAGADQQKLACVIPVFKRFCVVTGGPGTGKTHTVGRMLTVLAEVFDDNKNDKEIVIKLVAPTGKAAARLSESIVAAKKSMQQGLTKKTENKIQQILEKIPDKALTIHRLLGAMKNSIHFRHNINNRLKADVVVVDEASMVDLALMSKLVQALPHDARLILLGDKDQLASVEAGNVLGDVFGDFMGAYSKEFAEQIASVGIAGFDSIAEGVSPGPGDSIVLLEKSYRFDDTGEISSLKDAVNASDDEAVLSLLEKGGTDIEWIEPKTKKNFEAVISRTALSKFTDLSRITDPDQAMEVFNRFIVLCPLRRGLVSVEAINQTIERTLLAGGHIHKYPGVPWYRGRPVIVTRNDYNAGLFNGDTGVIGEWDSEGVLGACFPGRIVNPQRLPAIETAYALTVHKSQGSEFDEVLIAFPFKDNPVLTKELLYTAITRARKKVTIVGTREIIAATIRRSISRSSGLKKRLWR